MTRVCAPCLECLSKPALRVPDSEDEQVHPARRSLGHHPTAVATGAAQTERRATARPGPRPPDRHPLRAPDRHPLGAPAPGAGLRSWGDLLAPAAGLATGWGLGAAAPRT